MKKVLFISGKITGDENYKEKFRMAQRFYEALGYTVLNPAILPAGMSAEQYSRICLAMLGSADVVAMLPDWRASLGASAEWSTALFSGKEIIYMKGTEE